MIEGLRSPPGFVLFDCHTLDGVDDVRSVVNETVRLLTVRGDGDRCVGDAAPWFGEPLFGGFVIGQAVSAAHRWAPAGMRLHSLHAYFLRPVTLGEIAYRSKAVKEGRTLTVRRLDFSQAEHPVLTMTHSFTRDGGGYVYDLAPTTPIGAPNDQPTEMDGGPWETANLGPTPPARDGTRSSTHRLWARVAAALPDDPDIHAAFLGYLSDMTFTGGRPLHLDGDTRGMISIDHAVCFHRPVRADAWLHYDVHSLVNAGGRGTLRGTVRTVDGHIALSVVQEMLLRIYDE
jgi:acyl-CoA thioesterase-2